MRDYLRQEFPWTFLFIFRIALFLRKQSITPPAWLGEEYAIKREHTILEV